MKPCHLLRTLGGVLLVTSALAWSPLSQATCEEAYTSSELTDDLGAMTTALRADDRDGMINVGSRMEAGLPCIRSKVPAQVIATAYRFVGASQFYQGEQRVARRWFRSALELAPTYEFDVTEVPLGNPLRSLFESVRGALDTEPVLLAGKELQLPAGAELWLDGRLVKRPEATLERPHLLQVVATSDGTIRKALVIDGNAFPGEYLRDAAMAAVVPDTPEEKTDPGTHQPNYDLAVVQVKRVRPAAKTPLMVAGGVVALAGVGVYGATFATRNQFNAATTTADLERYQSLTNTLVLVSGATVAVGLGVEYAGIMLGSGGGGFRIGGRF